MCKVVLLIKTSYRDKKSTGFNETNSTVKFVH